MEPAFTPTTSGRRQLAFRIVGWLLGALTILPSLVYILLSLVSDDPIERSHRFHYVGGFTGFALIGVFSIVLVTRPDWTSAGHVLVAQTLAWLFGGLMGGDLISGFYITALVGLVVLAALHPDPRSLMRLPGRPSISLMIYALLCTIPAWIYAVTNAELQRVGSPTDPHVELHHWSGVAVAALAIAGAGLATSLRGAGWHVAAAATAVAAVGFGISGLVFSELPGAPPDIAWSWLAVAAGIGFWLLASVERAREGSAG
jgi:hypothetical protein